MSSCRDRAAERAETKCSQWEEQGTGSSPLIMIRDIERASIRGGPSGRPTRHEAKPWTASSEHREGG